MKLSISNIAWAAEDDEKIYEMMKEYSFTGLEIAPTRIFPEAPYDKLEEASKWREEIFVHAVDMVRKKGTSLRIRRG